MTITTTILDIIRIGGGPIFAALVAGVFAIISPVITYLVIKSYESRLIEPMSKDRRLALVGLWYGKTIQPSLTTDIEIRLDSNRKDVTGTAILRFALKGKSHLLFLDLKGGFLHDRFLKLEYAKKENDGAIQFGTIIAEFDANGSTISGQYAGYGSFTNKIVAGKITLTKQLSSYREHTA